MKKFICFIICILSFAMVAGCAGGGNNAGNSLPDAGIVDGNNTGEEDNFVKQDPVENKNVTYLQRATELVKNFDKLPTQAEVFETNSSFARNSRSRTSGYPAREITPQADNKGNVIDLTVPNENFYNDPSWVHMIVPSQILSYDILDTTIEYIIGLKTTVLTNVVQLGTWIRTGENDGLEKEQMRLNYDVNTDIATLEYLSYQGDQEEYFFEYTKILSCYTSNGRIAIKATHEEYQKYAHHTKDVQKNFSIEYVEGDFYRFSCFEPMYSVSSEAANEGVLAIEYPFAARTIVLERNYKDPSEKITMTVGESSYPDVDYKFVTTREFYKDENYRYTNQATEAYLSTLNGKTIYKITDWGIYINLYHLTGWDKCYADGGTTYLEIGGKPYSGFYGGFTVMTQEDLLLNTKKAQIPYLVKFFNPETYPGAKDPHAAAVAEAEEQLAACGLTCKEQALSEFYSHFEGKICQNTDEEKMLEEYEHMKLFKLFTKEEMRAIFEEDYVLLDEQISDENYISLLNASASGGLSYTEEGGLDFSSVRISLQKSLLLAEGTNFSLRLVLRGNFETIETEVSSARCNSEGVDLTFPEIFEFSFGELAEEEYSLLLYVVNEQGLRVSEYFVLNAKDDFVCEGEDFDVIFENGELVLRKHVVAESSEPLLPEPEKGTDKEESESDKKTDS